MILTLDIPRSWLLTSNQRLHWRETARRTRDLRTYARAVARHPSVRRTEPYDRRVHITAHVAWPDRRRRDEANLMSTLKPIVDGLVDAGVLTDDSTDWLIGPDLRPSDELCDRKYGCTITVAIEEAP